MENGVCLLMEERDWEKEERERKPKCVWCWNPTLNPDRICDDCGFGEKKG